MFHAALSIATLIGRESYSVSHSWIAGCESKMNDHLKDKAPAFLYSSMCDRLDDDDDHADYDDDDNVDYYDDGDHVGKKKGDYDEEQQNNNKILKQHGEYPRKM